MYRYTCIDICMYIYMYIYTWRSEVWLSHMRLQNKVAYHEFYVCMYIYIYIHMYMYVYICVCMCI